MSRVRSKNTGPELMVRKTAHRLGYRYRLHRKELPGTPDLVFPGRRSVIFVHGCFWHGHKDCSRSARPNTNRRFWNEKLDRNLARDKANEEALAAAGWHVLVIWECETKDIEALKRKLAGFLSGA